MSINVRQPWPNQRNATQQAEYERKRMESVKRSGYDTSHSPNRSRGRGIAYSDRSAPRKEERKTASVTKAGRRLDESPTGSLTIWRRGRAGWTAGKRTHRKVTVSEARERSLPHVGEWVPDSGGAPMLISTNAALLDEFRATGLAAATPVAGRLLRPVVGRYAE